MMALALVHALAFLSICRCRDYAQLQQTRLNLLLRQGLRVKVASAPVLILAAM